MHDRIVHYIVLILLLYCIEWGPPLQLLAPARTAKLNDGAHGVHHASKEAAKASRTAAVHGRAPFAPSLSLPPKATSFPHKRPLSRACGARSQAHPYSHPGPIRRTLPPLRRAALVRPCPPPTHPVVRRPCPSPRTASAPRDPLPLQRTHSPPARPRSFKLQRAHAHEIGHIPENRGMQLVSRRPSTFTSFLPY